MVEWLRPVPGDPSGGKVRAAFDLASGEWIVAAPGDYQAAAVEAWQRDGGNFQRCVALEWPGRRNRTDELLTVRLMIAPEDAVGLAEVLAHTGRWMIEHERRGN